LVLLIAAIVDYSTQFITYALVFIIGGVIVNRMARKTKKTGERYKQYIALIVNHSQNSLDAIAQSIGVPYAIVVEDLQKMIRAGFFQRGYIDYTYRVIVFAPPMPHQVWNTAYSGAAIAAPAAPPRVIVVICRSCGANNSVYAGYGDECEYCGSPIYG